MNKACARIVVGAIALALGGGVVMAQNIPEVKVLATRKINTKLVGHTSSGVPILELSVTYGVSLQDLDLSTASGAAEAEHRVNDAAQAACEQIGRQYADATPSDAQCTKAAARKAMVKVHALVAAAESAHKSG